MTSTLPRGGGLLSMGASLLDQVLAETLDPAYAQAAARKAERAGEEPPEVARRGLRVRGVARLGQHLVAQRGAHRPQPPAARQRPRHGTASARAARTRPTTWIR